MRDQSTPRIRKNIEDFGDPYMHSQEPHGDAQCRECSAVYHNQRWYLPECLPPDLKNHKLSHVVCPACRKIADGVPGGVLKLSGRFLELHRDDILHLLHNEENAARQSNPLERIMSVETNGTSTVVQTTNEKLAQRLGKAVHRAYGGELDYKWSEDTKLARVTWRRDV